MLTITRTQNRRTLLTSTSLAVNASKAVSALVRSGTTATATGTAHGFAVGDWIIISGSNYPEYNGPKQVATVADANTFTFAIERDPGADSGGTIAAQKGLAASIWGDGTTVGGNATVGALPTATGGDVLARVATTTAPTTACRVSVYRSPTGAAGTWRLYQAVDSTTTANDMSEHVIEVPRGQFVLVVFWRVAGTAVLCDCVGNEETSYVSA